MFHCFSCYQFAGNRGNNRRLTCCKKELISNTRLLISLECRFLLLQCLFVLFVREIIFLLLVPSKKLQLIVLP